MSQRGKTAATGFGVRGLVLPLSEVGSWLSMRQPMRRVSSYPTHSTFWRFQ